MIDLNCPVNSDWNCFGVEKVIIERGERVTPRQISARVWISVKIWLMSETTTHLDNGEVASQVVLPPDVREHGVRAPVAVRMFHIWLVLHQVQLLAERKREGGRERRKEVLDSTLAVIVT